MGIEIQNEGRKPIFVKACKGITGRIFVHVSDKKTEHINMKVEAENYKIINPEDTDERKLVGDKCDKN